MSADYLDTEYIFLPDLVRDAFAKAPFEPLIKNPNILELSFKIYNQNRAMRVEQHMMQQSYSVLLENLFKSFHLLLKPEKVVSS